MTRGVDPDGRVFDDGRLGLPDGRALAWRWWGEPGAPTVLRLQGAASSRLSGAPGLWQKLGIRVLAADRPGFGRSTRLPGRGISVVADDLAHLLDTLAIDSVPVLAHSAGGPHALAMSARHADRVQSLAIVSGACHLNADERAAVVKPNREAALANGWEALHAYLTDLRRTILDAGREAVMADAFAGDLASMRRPDRRAREQRNRAEALRQGAAGWADEALAIMGEWDFDLDDVRHPVRWWHGVHDNTVPISVARRLTDRLPDCELIAVEGKGHRLALNESVVGHLLGH